MKKKFLLFLTFVLVSSSLVLSQNTENSRKTISGFISTNNTALPAVNIKIENHINGTKTDSKGFYEVEARIGDVINFSHVGYRTVSIVVEDVTDVLNINMKLRTNELGTAVIKARKKVKSLGEIELEKRTATITTGVGKLDLKAIAQKVDYINGKTLNQAAPNFNDAISGKFTGVLPSIWDIDGLIFKNGPKPYIDISTVEDIYILSGPVGTVRWGGPVMIIKTNMSSDVVAAEKEKVAESYRNQNYYRNDAISLEDSEEETKEELTTKTISGMITYLNTPIPDVHILSESNKTGVKTDRNGKFSMQAIAGDELKFSHVSFSTVYVIVEDITEVLNLKMTPKNNELEEVYLENKIVKGEVLEQAKKAERKFTTARGVIDPKTSGFAVSYIDGDDLNAVGYASLGQALDGKLAGYSFKSGKPYLRGANMSITQDYPAIWDVDGQVFNVEPPISLSEIEDIYVLKAVGAVVKYGNVANGGVIVVKTKYGNLGAQHKKQDLSAVKLQNKDYYANDAVTWDTSSAMAQQFSNTLETFEYQEDAIAFYKNEWAKNIKDPHLKMTIAKKAQRLFPNKKLATIIYNDIAEEHQKNPEILKTLAYQFQAAGLKKEAIAMYKKVYTLRPTYAQSFRDLSNAYIENEQFKRGWRLYLSYLFQGHNLNDEGIGEILYNEMEWIYFNRKNQTEIKELFMPKSDDVFEFRDDIRVVVEWNTSEAEFDLEFVSPEKRSYVFEHTHAGGQETITKEKKRGYSSKQFFVDDLEEGDWLFNATYYGNKKPEPTYLKVTSYYNWGLPNQTQKTKVFTLNRTDTKFQLITYNKEDLQQHNTATAKN